MDRIAKIKIGCIVFAAVFFIGSVLFWGVVEYSRQQLLAENLEKGKAMLAEQDYQSARIYLSLFEEKGNTEPGFNLYNYVSAVIAYQTYLGTGDINQIQLASDYLAEIDMSRLSGYTGKVQELKSRVEGDLNYYNQQAEAQEQADAAVQAAEEAKNQPQQQESSAADKAASRKTEHQEAETRPAQETPAPKPSVQEQKPQPAESVPAVGPMPSVPSTTEELSKK